MVNEIDDTTQFYRDNLMNLMKWGIVVFIAMAGWLISGPATEEKFSFAIKGSVQYDRSIGLLALCAIGFPIWFFSVIVAKIKCRDYPNPTIPTWKYVITFNTLILLGVFIMMSLVLDWGWYLIVINKLGF